MMSLGCHSGDRARKRWPAFWRLSSNKGSASRSANAKAPKSTRRAGNCAGRRWAARFEAFMLTGQSSTQMALRDPDIRLMLRVRADDNEAFAELVEAYHQRLVVVMNHLVA